MLSLSKINSLSTVVTTSASNYKSVQNFVLDAIRATKSKSLTRNQIYDMVCDYTLTNQLDAWFDTEAKYQVFIDDANNVNDEQSANAFEVKYDDFNKAMHTKVTNLFFNPKHARSFIKNDKYNNVVTVTKNVVKLT